jgi:DMSO reductase anchor subunit
MVAKYILAVLAAVFLGMAALRMFNDRAKPQMRTWLLIAVIFGVVSAWLFYQE